MGDLVQIAPYSELEEQVLDEWNMLEFIDPGL